jgi:hypothetical protein
MGVEIALPAPDYSILDLHAGALSWFHTAPDKTIVLDGDAGIRGSRGNRRKVTKVC